MPAEDSTQLNPQIATTTIGRRNLRKIKIFPMSVGDQLSMTGIIAQVISALDTTSEDYETVGAVLLLIQEHIPTILEYIIDTDSENSEELLKDITNDQLVDIAQIVYEQNYASLAKKLKSLFEMVQDKMNLLPSPSKRQSQPSVKSTDTDSKTSIENDSEKAD